MAQVDKENIPANIAATPADAVDPKALTQALLHAHITASKPKSRVTKTALPRVRIAINTNISSVIDDEIFVGPIAEHEEHRRRKLLRNRRKTVLLGPANPHANSALVEATHSNVELPPQEAVHLSPVTAEVCSVIIDPSGIEHLQPAPDTTPATETPQDCSNNESTPPSDVIFSPLSSHQFAESPQSTDEPAIEFASESELKQLAEHSATAISLRLEHEQCEQKQRESEALCVRSATLIQSAWRAYRLRTKFREMQRAAVVMQAAWRRAAARKYFTETISKIVRLQANARRWLSRSQFTELRRQRAAAVIGRAFKLYSAKCRVRVAAAVRIQSAWRRYRSQKSFDAIRRAVIRIQSRVRMLTVRREFHSLKAAAVTLQRHWRGRVARTVFSAKRAAVVVLQAQWRGKLQRKQFISQRKAAVAIQRTVRTFLAVRRFQRMRIAAVTLQAVWRGLRLRRHRAVARQQCVIVQKYWRRFAARNNFLRMRGAAVLLQAVFRGMRQRRQFAELRRAATLGQRLFRGIVCRCAFGEMRHAAVVLQSAARMRTVRQQFVHTRQLIVRLQAVVRGFLQRTKYEQVLFAVFTAQRLFRGILARRRYFQIRQAAVALQAAVRMRAARSEFQRTRRLVVRLQSVWRGVRLRQHKHAALVATVTVQRWVRRWLSQRFAERRRAAVRVLQGAFHIWKAVRELRRLRAERDAAVRAKAEQLRRAAMQPAAVLGQQSVASVDTLTDRWSRKIASLQQANAFLERNHKILKLAAPVPRPTRHPTTAADAADRLAVATAAQLPAELTPKVLYREDAAVSTRPRFTNAATVLSALATARPAVPPAGVPADSANDIERKRQRLEEIRQRLAKSAATTNMSTSTSEHGSALVNLASVASQPATKCAVPTVPATTPPRLPRGVVMTSTESTLASTPGRKQVVWADSAGHTLEMTSEELDKHSPKFNYCPAKGLLKTPPRATAKSVQRGI